MDIMVNLSSILLYSILPILLGCSLLWIFYLQGKKYNRQTPHFILSLLFLILSSSLLSMDILLTNVLFSGGFFSTIALIFGSLSLYAYFRHYYAMNSYSHTIYQIYNYITIITISLHIPQLFFIVERPSDAFLLYFVQTTARFVLYILIGYYALFTAYTNYQMRHTRPTRIELIANILLIFSLVFVSIGNYGFIMNSGNSTFLRFIQYLGTFFGTITLIVLVGNYIVNPTYTLSIPIPIHAILIYNEGGIPVYSKIINQPETLRVNDYLISNAFTAITSLISEALGKKGDLKQIDFGVYQVYFGSMVLNNKLCIIASGASYFFKKSIEVFLKSVSIELIEELNKSITDNKFKPEIERLVLNSFPYLD